VGGKAVRVAVGLGWSVALGEAVAGRRVAVASAVGEAVGVTLARGSRPHATVRHNRNKKTRRMRAPASCSIA
jgi:hypothetical protein